MTTAQQTQPWNTTAATAAGRSLPHTIALWTLSIAAAGMFLMAGFGKLSGNPQMVGLFDLIGVGQWFRYVTGGIEVLGAVALFVPAVALYGALALAATMVGAVITHLTIIGDTPTIPVVLLATTAFIAWSRGSRR